MQGHITSKDMTLFIEKQQCYLINIKNSYTMNVLKFWTPVSLQTVQTQIRLLLKKQSDQGLLCLLFKQAFCDFKTW